MQMQQQQLEAEQQQAQMLLQQKQAELQQQMEANTRDNETKLMIAQLNAWAKQEDGIEEPEYSQEKKDKMMEDIKQFNAKLNLEKDKIGIEKSKLEEIKRNNKAQENLKRMQINKQSKAKTK